MKSFDEMALPAGLSVEDVVASAREVIAQSSGVRNSDGRVMVAGKSFLYADPDVQAAWELRAVERMNP